MSSDAWRMDLSRGDEVDVKLLHLVFFSACHNLRIQRRFRKEGDPVKESFNPVPSLGTRERIRSAPGRMVVGRSQSAPNQMPHT